MIQAGDTAKQYTALTKAVKKESITVDSVCSSGGRVNSSTLNARILSYCNAFRNIVFDIPRISEDKKLKKFHLGWKPFVYLEILESRSGNA